MKVYESLSSGKCKNFKFLANSLSPLEALETIKKLNRLLNLDMLAGIVIINYSGLYSILTEWDSNYLCNILDLGYELRGESL